MSSMWSLIFRLSDQNFVFISHLSYGCYMPHPSLLLHHPNKIPWNRVLLRIWEVQGWNLGPETGCPTWGFPSFSQPLRANVGRGPLIRPLPSITFPIQCSLTILSGLRMEAVCSSETLVSTYKFTRRYNPEDKYGHEFFSCISCTDLVVSW
jgi:hypothetical protein